MNTIENEKFGKLLVELRTEKGMTQKQLAEQLFISDKAISKWERGLSFPDISLLLPLCEIFDISTSELLSGNRMKENENISLEQSNQLIEKLITIKGKSFCTKDLLQQKERMSKTIRKIIIFNTLSFVWNVLLVMFVYGVIYQKITWLEIEKIGLVETISIDLVIIYNLLSLILFLYFSFKKSICYLFSSLAYIISSAFLMWMVDFLKRFDDKESALVSIQTALVSYVVMFIINVGIIVYGFYRYRRFREKI